MTQPVARILITDAEGKVLLHFRKDKSSYHFCFFGGRVEEGETAEIAAVRELEEEAGLKIGSDDLEYLSSWFSDAGAEVRHYKYVQPVSWADIHFGEKYGIAMVPYADLPTIPLADSMKWFYQQYPQLP